jgi:hypothetical protein
MSDILKAYNEAQARKDAGETVPVEIPIMRGGECSTITIRLTTDDPLLVYGATSAGFLTIGDESVEVRTHLLVPRRFYPAPPKWEGAVVADGIDDGVKLLATLEGIDAYARDNDDGEYYTFPDTSVPWEKVLENAPKKALIDALAARDGVGVGRMDGEAPSRVTFEAQGLGRGDYLVHVPAGVRP